DAGPPRLSPLLLFLGVSPMPKATFTGFTSPFLFKHDKDNEIRCNAVVQTDTLGRFHFYFFTAYRKHLAETWSTHGFHQPTAAAPPSEYRKNQAEVESRDREWNRNTICNLTVLEFMLAFYEYVKYFMGDVTKQPDLFAWKPKEQLVMYKT